MDRILPTVMVKNEERYIQAVLRPLVAVFGTALVADTGSTDDTLALARATGAKVYDIGPRGPIGLTATRKLLGEEALRLGAPWQMLVDGDELYREATLACVRDLPITLPTQIGFTAMMQLDGTAPHDLWEMAAGFQRGAVMPSNTLWQGEYPFDTPVVFNDPRNYFYYTVPVGFRYHAVHLHRLERSRDDAAVSWRTRKRLQFCLADADVPRTIPFDLKEWTT